MSRFAAGGLIDRSRALNFTSRQALWRIALPQAIPEMMPPFGNLAVQNLKDTALASVVAMPDLLKQATDAQALMANPTPLVGAALIYLVFLWPLVRLVSYLEKRGQRSYGGR